MKKTTKTKTFTVLVIDMYDYPDGQTTVTGFKTLEAAREYARRRTRDSVEAERPGSTSAKDLKDRWYLFGEDCVVISGDYSGGSELDFFIAHKATKKERDWVSLSPAYRVTGLNRPVET